ncbi:hypothetical protein DPMN_141081 [Dreissena polymorpha]|uniref:Uncharacterized protein n=1 Tax=Dreissena polymorpha TaxID=45954 RepID=A0A9D4JHY9_DREPO|nr:hypothetical protein DPMN_141081 [Dreissena polymorpha]
MGKERPVRIKRSSKRKSGSAKNVGEKICIIHFRQNKSDTTIKPLTDKTFEKIKSVVTERQASDDELIRLDDICSLVPEKVNQDIHGVHRWCYQSFTNSSSYLKRKSCDESKIQYPSASKRSRVSEKSTLFPYEVYILWKSTQVDQRKGRTAY